MYKIGISFSKITILSSLAILGMLGIATSAIPTESASNTNTCSTKSIISTSLIKTYHLLDLTDGFGISATKDGGYLLTGDTIPAAGMAAPKPFIVKTDAKGSLAWSRWFNSQSLALGVMSSRRIARLTTETTDGNIVMTNDMLDFVDAKYEQVRELYGDILVTKLTPKGNLLWSIMFGDYSEDRPRKIWALPNGEVMILGRFLKTGYGNNIADSDTVPRYSALIKIDKNGKILSTKKMDWEAEDMQRLADGSFIALANIAVTEPEHADDVIGPEVTMHPLPTMIRLDRNLKVTWAKSLEMIPSEIAAPTSYATSGITIGKTIIRLAGGDFRAIQPTPDGGFVAIGFDNLLLTKGLNAGSLGALTSFTPRSFVITKVNAAGAYQWTKKLTVNLSSGVSSNDFQVVKTVDGQFVIMQDVVRNSAAVQGANPSLAANVVASNIELIKTDADFNPRWTKKIDAERDISGYGIVSTADKGVAVAASLLTTKQHLVLGSLEPYKEATLIKVDTNGNINGCSNVSNYPQATIEDQSQYLVMQNMAVGTVSDLKLTVNKKVKEKVTAIKDTARNICSYKRVTVTPNCSYLTTDTATPTTAAKTWALINYENTQEVSIDGEKNQSIHGELLPILNQIYNNQVKLKDSMKSMWLTYIFPRLVTRADLEAVQKKYEELGYKIDESDGGDLWVSKIGQTLHLTFSIQNFMVGKLEVLF